MAEEAREPTRDPSAWLAKEDARSSSGYILRIETPAGAQSAMSDDDWVIVLEGTRLARIGRIARVRRDLDGLTIYLDRTVGSDAGPDVSNLGLTAPEAPVVRLGWDDFEKCLSAFGASGINDVPLINDPVHVREILEASVRDDLLGPAGGPEEDIVDMSVRDRYLVGKLAPINRAVSGETGPEPASAADEEGDLEDERKAPVHEPGAEFSKVSGRVDAESDALDEVDTSNNQSLVPSSMGMTFCVAPDVEEITVEARWGRYERVPNEEHGHVKRRMNRETGQEEEVKARVWRRIPCGGSKPLKLKDGPIDPLVVDTENEGVRVQGTIRTNKNGERLVTLFLVNTQEEPDENKDRAWMFQPELIVHGRDPEKQEAVFRRRPASESFADDPERDRLALIYRNRLEFAVGHGVSVHADIAPKDRSKAVAIRTEVIPRQEIEVTETPGLEPDDRQEMRRMVDEGWLDMTNLATMNETDLRTALSCLVDRSPGLDR